jgi:beta-lactamase regulating signal transducer with metallopeptidase domain
MIDSLATVLPVLGSALLHFVWQGALIAAITALGLFALRDAKARTRYSLACAALILCIALPVAHIVKMTGVISAGETESAALIATSGANINDKFMSTSVVNEDAFWNSAEFDASLRDSTPTVVSIWAIGVALMALRMGAGLLWVRRRVHHGVQQSNAVWQAKLNQMARRMGIQRHVRLGVSDQIESPVTAGWWRPIVILPAALLTGMPPELLEALLAHELGHVKRLDYLVNLLQSAIEILLFYHPAVWWLSKQIRIEREQIADDLAARLLGEPRRLALALSELEQFQFSPPQLAQAAHGGNLMSRIKHLVSPELPVKVFSWKMAIPLAGLSAACAVLYAQVGIANATVESPASNSATAVPLKSTAGTTSAPAVLVPSSSSNASAKNITLNAERKSSSRSESFALVKTSADGARSVTSNFGFESKEIEILGMKSKEETLWFRDNEKLFSIRDKATLDKVREAYKPMDELGLQMDLQGKKMDEQGKIMDAIGKQMDAASANQHHFDNSAFESAMRKHDKKMAELQKKMDVASAKFQKANSNEARSEVQNKMSEIQDEMQQVGQKMQIEQRKMAAEQEKLSASLEPLTELGKKMTEAGKPMTELGKEMGLLGKKMDGLAKQAEKQVKELIRSAKEKGLAIPDTQDNNS